MPRTNRRRTLIGLGTIVFGASGFVASGAVELGSEGSLGDDWVPVEGKNQAIDLGPVQTTTNEQSSEGGGDDAADGDDDEGSTSSEPDNQNSDDETDTDGEDETNGDGEDETNGDGEDETNGDGEDETNGDGEDEDGDSGDGGGDSSSTRVQVVTDPNNPGNAVNAGGPVTWSGSVVSDSAIAETSDGFFQGIKDTNLNRQGTTVYGSLSGGLSGYPTTPVFIIANVGPVDGGVSGAPVSVSTALYAGDTEIDTEQIRFPYRAVDASGTTIASGSDLFDASVTLGVGDVIEVAVVFDTNGGSDKVENVDTIRFSAIGVSE